MAVTLKDLAAELNLSISTVSRVLNGKGVVSDETRRRICETAAEMGYVPNEYARSLRVQKYRSIGVLVCDVTNPYYNGLLKSVEMKCSSENYSMMVGVSNYSRQRDEQYINEFISHGMAGLILTGFDNNVEQLDIKRDNVHIITVNELADSAKLHSIAIDNRAAMADLTQYLINLGHRSIACLYGSNDDEGANATASLRFKGYLDCMERNGIEVNPRMIINAGLSYESGVQAAQQLLCLPERPTAVVCHNNSIGVAVFEALTEAGYSVPEDISIACFDAIVPSNVVARKFTCIRQPIELIGRAAVDLIIELSNAPEEKETEYRKIKYPYRLIVGDTTRPYRS